MRGAALLPNHETQRIRTRLRGLRKPILTAPMPCISTNSTTNSSKLVSSSPFGKKLHSRQRNHTETEWPESCAQHVPDGQTGRKSPWSARAKEPTNRPVGPDQRAVSGVSHCALLEALAFRAIWARYCCARGHRPYRDGCVHFVSSRPSPSRLSHAEPPANPMEGNNVQRAHPAPMHRFQEERNPANTSPAGRWLRAFSPNHPRQHPVTSTRMLAAQ